MPPEVTFIHTLRRKKYICQDGTIWSTRREERETLQSCWWGCPQFGALPQTLADFFENVWSETFVSSCLCSYRFPSGISLSASLGKEISAFIAREVVCGQNMVDPDQHTGKRALKKSASRYHQRRWTNELHSWKGCQPHRKQKATSNQMFNRDNSATSKQWWRGSWFD